MKTKNIYGLTLILFSSVIILGLLVTHPQELKLFLIRTGLVKVGQHNIYAGLTFKELVKDSDIVFTGQILEITPSKWNQNSGEYWEKTSADQGVPLQYHILKISVSKIIIDKIHLNNQPVIEVTVLGPSPLESNADYLLSVDDNVVVFAKSATMSWKDNSQGVPIIRVETAPSLSLFVEDKKTPGFFKGEIIRDTGNKNFETINSILEIQDLTKQIQDINQQP